MDKDDSLLYAIAESCITRERLELYKALSMLAAALPKAEEWLEAERLHEHPAAHRAIRTEVQRLRVEFLRIAADLEAMLRYG